MQQQPPQQRAMRQRPAGRHLDRQRHRADVTPPGIRARPQRQPKLAQRAMLQRHIGRYTVGRRRYRPGIRRVCTQFGSNVYVHGNLIKSRRKAQVGGWA